MSRRAASSVLLAIGVGAWCLLVFFVVPWTLSAAYDGGVPILDRWVHGRSGRPLSSYLGFWRRYALLGTLLLAVLTLARHPLFTPWSRRVLDAPSRHGPGRALLLWTTLGLAAGVLEGGARALWFLVEADPSRPFDLEFVWMAPLASGLAFAVLGAVAVVALGALSVGYRPRPFHVASGALVALAASLATFAGLRVPAGWVGVAPWAVAMLSVGLGLEVARWADARPGWFASASNRVALALSALSVGGAAVGAWHLPGPAERRAVASLPPAEAGTPNILLLILDTVRARNLSFYGYELPTTPNLERWAQRGVVFEHAISPSSWTLPAHASIFTGRWHHEVSADYGVRLDEAHATLAEVLAARGYRTAGFSANTPNAAWGTGLARGFQRYEDYPITWGPFLMRSWLSRMLVRWIPLDKSDWRIEEKTARENTSDVLRWLERRDDRPFFAFVNYYDAHSPFNSPRSFQDRFPSEAPVLLARRDVVTEWEMDGTRARYDAAIAYIDSEVDRLLSALEGEGVLENTIVVVTSDHGEMLGKQGLQFHANSLYMPVIRVPLLILDPRGTTGGQRVSTRVSTRNVAATVLDLAGVDATEEIGGQTLTPLWRPGASIQPAPDATVLSQLTAVPWESRFAEGTFRSVIADDRQVISNPDGTLELYDLNSDLEQSRDLAAHHGNRDLLRQMLERMETVFGPEWGGILSSSVELPRPHAPPGPRPLPTP